MTFFALGLTLNCDGPIATISLRYTVTYTKYTYCGNIFLLMTKTICEQPVLATKCR